MPNGNGTATATPDSLALRLRTLRNISADMQRVIAQSKKAHDDLLVRISKLVAVNNFSVNMIEGAELEERPVDLYVKWTHDGSTPMDEMEKKEVYSFVATLKGLGYKLIKEQESPHDIEAWFNVR